MPSPPDMSILDDLSVDELRWLEASEILEFPTSPVEAFQFNDSVVPRFSHSLEDRSWSEDSAIQGQPMRSSRKVERIRHLPSQSTSNASSQGSSPAHTPTSSGAISSPWPSSLPTPPSTPIRVTSTRNSGNSKDKRQDSPSEWLYRRPRNTITPAPSALASSLTLHQLPSSAKPTYRCQAWRSDGHRTDAWEVGPCIGARTHAWSSASKPPHVMPMHPAQCPCTPPNAHAPRPMPMHPARCPCNAEISIDIPYSAHVAQLVL
ncbi:hypothetical protein CC2G_000863 [Coprinopsis cinerea AmutBmut pab1-1]|nr:hypothetical protein CC2G_000863 [Coprinopsis cinerea AmutBmut pab1-1]